MALFGTLLQLILAGVLTFLWQWTTSPSALVATIALAGGVLPWLMAAVLFYCRQLRQQELLELEELAERRGEDASIFQGQDKSTHPAAARLAVVDRWVIPIFTLVWAAFHATVGILLLRYLSGRETAPEMANTGAAALFSALVVFVAFLFSRYATGMAHEAVWRPLRATGSYLLACVLFVVASAAAMVAAWQGYTAIDGVVAKVVPVLQIVLAVELALNFILDLYRPRLPGEEHRLAFDSRLLNLLAEPERIGHSIAETLNYQFGFEVSKTWFYKLLGKALLPLILLGLLVMWGMTSLVIVHEGRRGVVLHWGRAQQGRLLEPGMNVKWPWPVDTVRMFDIGAVHSLQVGVGEQQEPYVVRGREFQLWTQKHGAFRELPFLLAIPREAAAGEAESGADVPPPVHIINLVLDVQYRIDDPYKFGYRYVDAGKMLESAAYRETIRYCASATLDRELGGATDRPQAIMTSGWEDSSKALHDRIAQAVGPDGLDLGVDIASVRLTAVHPPAEAAPDFEAVLAAERDQDRQRYQAEGAANRTLADAAGDPDLALELSTAIRRVEQLDSLANLVDRPEQFGENLRGYIRQAVEQLKSLRKEIELEGLTGRLEDAGADKAADGAGRLGRRLGEYAGKAGGDLGALLGQIADWSMLDELGAEGTARQRLAARQAENLLELLAVRDKGVRCDFKPLLAAARGRADALFGRATGQAAKLVAEAQGYRLRVEMAERTRAERFQREYDMWKACPELYVLDRRLDVWDAVLPGMVKYVICVDPDLVEVWLNWERETRGISTSAFEGE